MDTKDIMSTATKQSENQLHAITNPLVIVSNEGSSASTEVYTSTGEPIHGVTDVAINISAEDAFVTAYLTVVGVRLGFKPDTSEPKKCGCDPRDISEAVGCNETEEESVFIRDDTANFWKDRAMELSAKNTELEFNNKRLSARIGELQITTVDAFAKGFRLASKIEDTTIDDKSFPDWTFPEKYPTCTPNYSADNLAGKEEVDIPSQEVLVAMVTKSLKKFFDRNLDKLDEASDNG